MTPFRLYDPALGRFTSIDPLADFMPTINPYSFGFDNPISFGDPDGLGPIKDLWRKIKEAAMSIAGYRKMGSWKADNVRWVKKAKKGGKSDRGSGSDGKNRDNGNRNSNSENTSNNLAKKIAMPERPQFGEPNLRIEANDVPDTRDIPEDPETENSSIQDKFINWQNSGSFFPTGQRIQAPPSRSRNEIIYLDDETLNKLFFPIVNTLLQHGGSTITFSFWTGLSKQQRGDNGLTGEQLLLKRYQFVKELIEELGIDPERIKYGAPQYEYDNRIYFEINK